MMILAFIVVMLGVVLSMVLGLNILMFLHPIEKDNKQILQYCEIHPYENIT
jgi:hypothetical protein